MSRSLQDVGGTLGEIFYVDADGILVPIDVSGLAAGYSIVWTGTAWVVAPGGAADISAALANISALSGLLAAKAPLMSPYFRGIPRVPTQATGDNSLAAASTAYVQGELAAAGVTDLAQIILASQIFGA